MTFLASGAIDHLIGRVRRQMEKVLMHQPTIDFSAGASGQAYPTEEELRALPNRGLAPFIDHTLLKADATQPMIDRLCDEALEFQFAAVCVNPGSPA